MRVRSVLHTVIVLLALVASGPFHQWIHGDHGSVGSGHHEIHNGACEHFQEHRGDDSCLLCIGSYGHAILLVRSPISVDALTSVHVGGFDPDSDRAGNPLVGVLGARAPPVSGC